MADQSHRLGGISDIHPNLFACKQCNERRKGGNERNNAATRDAGGRAHHILLRNAEGNIAVRIGGGEAIQSVRILQVGRARHDILSHPDEFDNPVGEMVEAGIGGVKAAILPRLGGKRTTSHAQITLDRISAIAASASEGSRYPRCQPGSSSM
jgi:hypothetical protein